MKTAIKYLVGKSITSRNFNHLSEIKEDLM